MNQLAAEFLAHFGDPEAAVVNVERAVGAGLFDLAWLDLCPVLERARSLPRFVAARAAVAERARLVVDALGA
jgi:hypothetical protein